MSKHALLSPSSAGRWLACTPSARLEAQFPDSSGEAAQEGTLAHSLCELILQYKLKLIKKNIYESKLKEIQANRFYDHAMHDHCDNYAVYVLEQFSAAQAHTKDAQLFLEQKLDMTDYVEEGFGTGDAVIIADGVLDLTDFKYGKGVPVTAVENKQMMLYGLGALKDYGFLYDIHTVRMTIYQPRLDTISVWEISVVELYKWAEDELRPKAVQAFKGEGEYAPGSHCRFCKAKAVCRANADYNLELAKHDFKPAPTLKDEEISDILDRADGFTQWLKAVEEYALDQAVNHGKKWPGHKLVEGRSNRQYTDEAKVAEVLKRSYAEDIIYQPQKLRGITDMEKVLGKKEFAELLKNLIIKPPGKPALVPESDKRPEYNSTESAIRDFAEN